MENKNESKIRKMSYFQKFSPVNLQFQDLTYTIPQGRTESKLILRRISGQFRSGQLSAILGSSGSGKTTLLNILAGYKTVGVNGTVIVNDRPIVLKEFLQLSRYIMQETLLQSFLTVEESMVIAAQLKLTRELGQDPIKVVSEILEILGLTGAKDNLSNQLSGGERKRLSIALELINNPPVIFLDEPTTGLDEVTSSQCISLLKDLAEAGRTIICSIHTPSARIFEKFDNVYIMSDGYCAYQGYGQTIVPFLSNLGLSCPKHYNPADFVIEVTSGQYGDDHVGKMIKEIKNGKNISYCKDYSSDIVNINSAGKSRKIISAPLPHRNECFRQFKILLYRRWLQTYRNKQTLLFKIGVYIFIGVFIGSLYFDVGQVASKKVIFNFSFCYIIIIQFMFLSIMPVTAHFPSEIKLIQREHFNKWYGLTAYYLAMSLTTLSINIIMMVPSIGISYIMSNQIMELDRFMLVVLILSLVVIVAESFGLLLSSVFNIKNGMFMTPVLSCPLLILACYGVGEDGNLPIVVRIFMYGNYLRYAYEGILLAIYGGERPYLECPDEEVVCWFRDPKRIITFIGLQNTFIWFHIIALVIWFFIFRITGFYLLRLRLQTNNPIRSLKYLIQNTFFSNKF